MSFFNKYPYLDEHELNLDWLIAKMRSLQIEFDEFKVVNQISFSGAWDITKQYPAWTIVSDNNIGFVSIKPVPAGVLLTNGNYWREVIDYSAQIAGLQSRVVALENTVGDASSGLVKDMNDAQSDITDIKTILKRRFIFQGDSYMMDGTGGFDQWGILVPQYLNLDASQYIQLYNDGAAFSDKGALTNQTWQEQLEATTISDPETITDVVVIGGANERTHTYAEIETALSDYVDYCNTTFPNAKVWIGIPSYSTTNSIILEIEQTIYPCYKKTSIEKGVAFLDGLYNELVFADNFYDYLHPDQDTSEDIARYIANALQGGNTVIKKNEAATITFDAGIAGAGSTNISMNIIQRDDLLVFKSSYAKGVLVFNTTTTIGDAWYKIGDIDKYPVTQDWYDLEVPIVYKDSANNYINDVVDMRFGGTGGTEVYIRTRSGITNATVLYFSKFNDTLPVRLIEAL